MIWDDDYPPGYLAITAVILLAMTVNAAVLTVRDLGGTDLGAHAVTAAAVAIAAVGAVFAVLALHRRPRLVGLRSLAVAGLTASVVAATVPGDIPPRDGVPWILHLGFVGMVAGAVCLRRAWFAGYCVFMLAGQWRLATPSVGSAALLLVVAIGVAALAYVKGQVLRVTTATAGANRRAAAAAVERTRATAAQAALEQWNAWVHDHLLVVLRLGSQQSPAAAELAGELVSAGFSRPEVPSSDLRRAALEVAGGHGVRLHWDVTSDGDVPLAVSQALESAVGEAIRNAARHSGAATVAVRGELDPARCHVTVTDAGRGFDPGDAGSQHLGIRNSIVAQMEATGGWAEVLSEPGSGTQVRLGWEEKAEPAPALELPLAWVVVAASGMTALHATRAWLALGADGTAWIAAGFMAVILLTVVVSLRPRLSVPALWAWLVAGSILVLTSPATGDRESQNWLAIGSAALFIAVARMRRERAGLVFAAGGLLVNLILCTWFRPADALPGLVYWAQPVLYAGLAWLGIAQFERLLHRYRDASRRAVALQRGVITAQAERDESERWLAGMPAEVLTLLEELSSVNVADRELAHRCALAESATRDYLTAPRLVNPALAELIRSIREQGSYVSLADGGPRTPSGELATVRAALTSFAGLAQPPSRITVRWTTSDPACFATLTITRPRRHRGRRPPSPRGTEVLSDADSVHVRFLVPGSA